MQQELYTVEWITRLDRMLESRALALGDVTAYQYACVRQLRTAIHARRREHNAAVDELAALLGIPDKPSTPRRKR